MMNDRVIKYIEDQLANKSPSSDGFPFVDQSKNFIDLSRKVKNFHQFMPQLDQAAVIDRLDYLGVSDYPQLKKFYLQSNGLGLFDGTLMVDSLLGKINRDPNNPNILMPLLEYGMEDFSLAQPDLFSEGWISFGAIPILSSINLVLNKEGKVSVELDGKLGVCYDSIVGALKSIAALSEVCFENEEIREPTYREYNDAALFQFGFRPQQPS